MTKCVEWNQPYDADATANLICRMTLEDVVKVQRAHAMAVAWYVYETDEKAIEDFITVHWGRIVEL